MRLCSPRIKPAHTRLPVNSNGYTGQTLCLVRQLVMPPYKIWVVQTLATAAQRIVPQCSAAALKNLMWALGTAGFSERQLLLALEAQLLSQSPYLG